MIRHALDDAVLDLEAACEADDGIWVGELGMNGLLSGVVWVGEEVGGEQAIRCGSRK